MSKRVATARIQSKVRMEAISAAGRYRRSLQTRGAPDTGSQEEAAPGGASEFFAKGKIGLKQRREPGQGMRTVPQLGSSRWNWSA